MCGRYAASARPEELVEEFEADDHTGTSFEADYNVAPTKPAPVVLTRVPRQEREAGGEPVRQLRILTWGLVPSWSKSANAKPLINARVETLFDKPAYRRAARARRAIAPAAGWYEWERPAEGAPARGPKQPFYMTRRDGASVALAAVYEFWRDPSREDDDPLAWLTTFAVLTTQAEPGLAHIHDRMPVVLDPDRWQRWLDPTVTDPVDIAPLLTQGVPPGRFQAMPVSSLVSNARNNGPDLVKPVEIAGTQVDATTGEVQTLPGL
ncbi:MAG: SOS response-associated peptidase [Actinomycetales bacterium]